MKGTLKLGDRVMWSGAWGTQAPQPTKVESIELCEKRHTKYGQPVIEASWAEQVERCVVTLSNGHWAYGYQLTPIS